MPLFAFGVREDLRGSLAGKGTSSIAEVAGHWQTEECFIYSGTAGFSCFVVGGDSHQMLESFVETLAKQTRTRAASFKKTCFFEEGATAVELFLRILAGLDANLQVRGGPETFRGDFEAARQKGQTGPVLNKLYQRGLWLTEKIRIDLKVGRSTANPEAVVCDLAEKIFGNLREHRALIACGGLAGEPFDAKLTEKNIGQILYLGDNGGPSTPRANERNKTVAASQLSSILPTVDLVLLLDGAAQEKLASVRMAQVMSKRKNAPQLWVSLLENGEADTIPDLSKFYNVYFYQKRDLDKIVLSNLKDHEKTSGAIKRLLEKEVEDFFAWVNTGEQHRFGSIVGRSEAMQKVFDLIARISQTDISILIDGESGTGKELVAKAIHDHSARASNPFVVVNCGAIPETLLESELFGHVKGAFTGAANNKIGLIKAANHGTIFLDEIGETSQATQVKLLRFLQEGEVKPVGSNETERLDVRVLTATNRDLELMVDEGHFRQDLYYRLNVIQLTLPPLRSRKEDVAPLTTYFLNKYAALTHKTVLGVDESAQRLLENYDWPGNIRELENAIERAVALSSARFLNASDFPPKVCATNSLPRNDFSADDLSLKEIEKDYIAAMLKKHEWNYELVTQILGIGRTTLWRKMKEYNISS